MSEPGLLEVLDAMVRSDQGPSGFTGRLAIGLKDRPKRWWVVEFGSKAACGFVEAVPKDVDAWLGLGPEEAKAILGKREMPSAPAVVTAGDRGLIERFCRRYIKSFSLLSVRVEPGV